MIEISGETLEELRKENVLLRERIEQAKLRQSEAEEQSRIRHEAEQLVVENARLQVVLATAEQASQAAEAAAEAGVSDAARAELEAAKARLLGIEQVSEPQQGDSASPTTPTPAASTPPTPSAPPSPATSPSDSASEDDDSSNDRPTSGGK